LDPGDHTIGQVQLTYDDPATGERRLMSAPVSLHTTVQTTYQAAPSPAVQTHILALAKYRQTQIAEQKLAGGDRQGAVTMLQTAAQTALQMGDTNAAAVLQGNVTQLQAGAELSEAMQKRTRMVAKTVLQASEPLA
jgi:Ca-activated chloride channel homolog